MELVYNKNGNPTGHICKCGATHKWSVYVFAHWHTKLIFKCDNCGREIILLSGNIIEKLDE